ncbi:hypothetical protein BDB01DRAFT_811149 [Pilobolus umbonatus]|nr:hypothetical protein BDB01DRAFT_811149 [Pilobolus umbonatus]
MLLLPSEIISEIIKKTSKDDYPEFLRVNRHWYNVIIPLLYNDISIITTRHLELFMKSLALYPRSIEAGKYIQQLRLSYSLSECYSELSYIVDTYFVNAMVNCPNLVYLKIKEHSKINKKMIYEGIPPLYRLKSLDIECNIDKSHEFDEHRLTGYCKKYGLSVTSLKLDKQFRGYWSNSPHIIQSFLIEFPYLTSLSMPAPKFFNDSSEQLDKILECCPKLTSMTYFSRELCPSDYDINPKNRYPFLVELTLSLDMMCLKDIEYIECRFKYLKTLTITISNEIRDMEQTIAQLVNTRSLSTINIEVGMDSIGNIDTVALIWNYCSVRPRGLLYEKNDSVIFTPNNESCSIQKITMKKSYQEIQSVKAFLNGRNINDVICRRFIKLTGSTIQELTIKSETTQPTLNLSRLNKRCPHLHSFTTSCTDIEEVKPRGNNTSLKYLCLDSPSMTRNTFRTIELNYPFLKELVLVNCRLDLDCINNRIYHLFFPFVCLSSLTLKNIIIGNSKGRIMVRNILNNDNRCLWYYCSDIGRTLIVTDKDIMDSTIHKQNTTPLCVIYSHTVTSVNIYEQ